MNHPRPVALVTGGATGIGRACSISFARRGFDVVINYSRSEAEAQKTQAAVENEGALCEALRCDVSSTEAVEQLFKHIAERFQRLDVLVNNAGTTQFLNTQNLALMTDELWDEILSVNLKAPFHCIRAAESLLRESTIAAVVNVSSVAGLRGNGSCHAYTASKGGLNALTKSLAAALGPSIRVNAVCPGPVDTRWGRDSITAIELENAARENLIPRVSTPEDIASTIVYLALDTTMTTGQLLVVDGGRTM